MAFTKVDLKFIRSFENKNFEVENEFKMNFNWIKGVSPSGSSLLLISKKKFLYNLVDRAVFNAYFLMIASALVRSSFSL